MDPQTPSSIPYYLPLQPKKKKKNKDKGERRVEFGPAMCCKTIGHACVCVCVVWDSPQKPGGMQPQEMVMPALSSA